MLRAIALGLAGVVLAAQPAAAIEWFTDTAEGVTTTAAFEGANSVAISCEAGALIFSVRVRQPELAAPVAGAGTIYVLTTADPAADGSTPSFTARATPGEAGSLRSFALSAKDSAARIADFTSAKSELEFSLLIEPGGERFNSFLLPVAGAGDALAEVLAACAAGPAAPSTEPPPAASSSEAPPAVASTEPPPAETSDAPVPKRIIPIGPGPLADSQWHLERDEEAGRVFAYRLGADGNSLTLECSRSFLRITRGLPANALESKLATGPRANVIIDGDGRWSEITSSIVRDDTAFYSLSNATRILKELSATAPGHSVTVGLGLPTYGPSPSDEIYHGLAFEPAEIRASLVRVIAACGETAPAQDSATPAKRPEWKLPIWRGNTFDGGASVAADISADGGTVSVTLGCKPGASRLQVTIPRSAYNPGIFVGGAQITLVGDGSSIAFPVAAQVGSKSVAFSFDANDAAVAYDLIERGSHESEWIFDIAPVGADAPLARIRTGVDGLRAGLGQFESQCFATVEDGVWAVVTDSSDFPAARVKVGDARLSFLCVDGVVIFEYAFKTLDEHLAGLSIVDVAFGIDPHADGSWSPSIVTENDLHGGDVGYYTFFRGPAADKWADMARRANRSIKVALTQPNRGPRYNLYNLAEFPAKGSTAAIKELQAMCH